MKYANFPVYSLKRKKIVLATILFSVRFLLITDRCKCESSLESLEVGNCFLCIPLKMANIHCQLNRIWNHLGETSLGVLVRMFPGRFNCI